MLEVSPAVLDALPDAARAKLEAAAAAREAARAAYRHSSDREQEARIDLGRAQNIAVAQRQAAGGYSFTAPREDPEIAEARRATPVEAAKRALETRVAARDRAAAAQDGFAYLEGVEAWLARTPAPHGGFKPAKASTPKSKAPAVDVAAIRHRLVEIDELFEKVESARAPKADLIAAANAEIDAFAASGALTVHPADRTGSPLNLATRFSLRPHATGALIGDAGAAVIAWLLRDALKAEAQRLIADLPDAGAMSDAEREQAFSDLAAERLSLERQEELLIEQAEASGHAIVRRANIDPRAFLSIEA